MRREEFLTTTLHQLRTPLSSINGYTSVLLTGELGTLNSRQKETLGRVQEICRSMQRLIGKLLTLAQSGVQRSPLSKEFVDLNQVARDVLRLLQGEVRNKKLRLVIHLPAQRTRFWADPNDMTQIFLNLLSNAVKFTPKGGRIVLGLSNRSKKLSIPVADTGIGIPSEDVPKIFEGFYQGDHPEVGAATGSGLGLTIVKRIVDHYHGQVTLDSRVGKGSRFRVVLPISHPRNS